ncbi:MAG: JAB domain-containing protein [Methylococcales bacterium]
MKHPHTPGLNLRGQNKIPHFVSDERGKYRTVKPLTEAQIIRAARSLLNGRFKPGEALTSPQLTSDWLRINLMDLEHEVFVCLFLNNKHIVIKHEVLFRGTIDGASVYPREVAKRCLQLNAAAVLFAHNHPSGIVEASMADRSITAKLKDALSLFDVRVIDHFIIGKESPYSFAEHGLI